MTKSFCQWMNRFEDEETRYGDLVRDMKSDYDFPDNNDRYEIEWYLSVKCNACNDALDTFRSAFDDYEIYTKSFFHCHK